MAVCWAFNSALRPVGPKLGSGWCGRPLGPAGSVITLSQHLPGSRGSSGLCLALGGLPLSPAAASPASHRAAGCRRARRALPPGLAPGSRGHAARAPVLCLLPRGQCRPCVRLVIRSPSLPTCLPSAPSSPARQSLCPALRAPKISWHLRPSLSKTREGRRGPGRLGGVVRLGGKVERSLVGRLRPSRCGPSPQQVCLSPCPHPSPGHTHPERPQHLRGQQVQGVRGRGLGPVPRALGLGLTRTVCEYLGTRGCHEVTRLPLGCPTTEGTEPLPWQVPWLSVACHPDGPSPRSLESPRGHGASPSPLSPEFLCKEPAVHPTSRQGPVSGEGEGQVCLESAGWGTSGHDPFP